MDDAAPDGTSTADRRFVMAALGALAALGETIIEDLVDAGVDASVVGNSTVATLLSLADAGSLRPVELARRVGMTTGGMTKVIDRLEARGLVRRDADGVDDGRAVLITLTASGARTVDTICDVSYPSVRKAIDDLTHLDR